MVEIHKPKPTYLPLPAMLLLQGMVWLTESQATSNPKIIKMISDLPLRTMWIAVICFTAGLVIQDLYNPQSWLRQWFRRSKQLFVLGEFTSVGYQANRSLNLSLIAHRPFSNGKILVSCQSLAPGSRMQIGTWTGEWHHAQKEDHFAIPIASISVAEEANCTPRECIRWGIAEDIHWGTDEHRERRGFSAGMTCITITAQAGVRKQTAHIWACGVEPNGMARMIIWDEDQNVIYAT